MKTFLRFVQDTFMNTIASITITFVTDAKNLVDYAVSWIVVSLSLLFCTYFSIKCFILFSIISTIVDSTNSTEAIEISEPEPESIPEPEVDASDSDELDASTVSEAFTTDESEEGMR